MTTPIKPKPGDVVLTLYPGAHMTKRRPGIVVSTDLYHATRPDVIVALVTTQMTKAIAPTDYVFQDWSRAGLRRPSAFRAYVEMFLPMELRYLGHLSDRDWQEVRGRLRLALAVT